MAKIKVGYIGNSSTTFHGDVDEFIEFIKDGKRQALMINSQNNRTLIIKDKICFVEFTEE